MPPGGSGTAGGHWRETTFKTELMTGFLNSGVKNPLSRLSVGTLQDMGYTAVFNIGGFKDLAESGIDTEPA